MRARRGLLALIVVGAIACGGSGIGDIPPEESSAVTAAPAPSEVASEPQPASPAPGPTASSAPPAPAAPPADAGSSAPGWPGIPLPPFDGGWIPPIPGLDGAIPWPNGDGGSLGPKDGGGPKGPKEGGIFDGIFDGGLLPF